MKLVSFVSAGRPGYGVVKDGGVVDLSRRFGDRLPTLRALLAAGALAEAEAAPREAAPDFPLEGPELAPVKRNPPLFVRAGSVAEVETSGIGVLRNPVVAENEA